MAHSIRATLVKVLIAALGPAAAAQTTWVVDDNGTGDFVHIQDAVDAAQDGDVISVLDGAYAGFTIDGKSLVVTGEAGGDVLVAASVSVWNLAAGQRVELDNMRMGLTFALPEIATVSLVDNVGSVRIVDCEVLGIDHGLNYSYPYPSPFGLGSYSSADVGVLRCSIEGGYYFNGGPGIFALASNLTITDTTIVGQGGFDSYGFGAPGAPGVDARGSSTVVCVGSTLIGGPHGDPLGPCDCCCSSGADGPGIRLVGSTGTWKNSTFNGDPGPDFQPTQFAAFCFGTYEECPCGNNGAAGAGCNTSYDSGGVELSAAGNPSVASDTVTLSATGFRTTGSPSGLFFQGTTKVGGGMGAPFNDGLLCASGTILRLKGKLAVNGAITFGFGNPVDQPVSVKGAIPPEGGTRTYQVWYRNQAALFCTSERFNMSNGLEITWLP